MTMCGGLPSGSASLPVAAQQLAKPPDNKREKDDAPNSSLSDADRQPSRAAPANAEGALYRLGLERVLDYVLQCGVSSSVKEAQTPGSSTGRTSNFSCGCACRAGFAAIPSSPPSPSSDGGISRGPPPGATACTAACGGPPAVMRMPQGTAEDWDVLKEAATRGAPTYPWALVKVVLAGRLYGLFSSLGKKQQRQLRSFEWERARDTVYAQVLSFRSPPLTLQRLCEVALKPEHQHVEKLYFSLRKLLRVRDGCFDPPSVPPLSADVSLSDKIAAANAVRPQP